MSKPSSANFVVFYSEARVDYRSTQIMYTSLKKVQIQQCLQMFGSAVADITSLQLTARSVYHEIVSQYPIHLLTIQTCVCLLRGTRRHPIPLVCLVPSHLANLALKCPQPLIYSKANSELVSKQRSLKYVWDSKSFLKYQNVVDPMFSPLHSLICPA